VIQLGRRSNSLGSSRKAKWLVGFIVLSLLGGVAVAANFDWIRGQYQKLTALDYQGSGTGEVVVRVETGEDGLAIAKKLFDAGVIRDVDSFYRLLLEKNPIFYPGSFTLKLQMSNETALKAVTDQANILSNQVTIPEGYRAFLIFNEISRVTGIPVDEFWLAAENLSFYGIPEEAPTIEGYLFPDTYSFDLEATAEEIIGIMVARMEKALTDAGVAKADWHRVLTLASITQREAKQDPDFYKVARVFANRVEIGMPLETDPTITYNYDGTDMSEVSREEQIAYGYNTYIIDGLPPGPISSPGELAIDATLNPAAGDWLFFVTINLETGETKFSKTIAEHESWIPLLRQWERENPNWYDE
jgi:UPF0755 protein